ncbi:hypothetical protein LguiB_026092 [Lonicera macranthoides]
MVAIPQGNKSTRQLQMTVASPAATVENTKNVRGRRKKEEKRRSGTGEDGAAVRRWESGR